MAQALGKHVNEKRLKKDSHDVNEFEKKLAKILIPEQQRINVTKIYNIMTLLAVENLAPSVSISRRILLKILQIDWTGYFRAILPANVFKTLCPNTEVWVFEPEYLRRLNELLKATDPRVLQNYVIFRFLFRHVRGSLGN